VLAYLLPHDPMLDDDAKRQDMSRFVVSVDRIERLTGLDFFANLPAAVQAAIEAEPAAEWPFQSN
jgi:DNA/RNA endonuclease G (NUC1)